MILIVVGIALFLPSLVCLPLEIGLPKLGLFISSAMIMVGIVYEATKYL